MNGYVKNKSNTWRHAMKRSIGPGHKIALDELFAQYGEKHDLKPGKEFVEWLKSIKLKDRSTWEIVYNNNKEKEVDLTPDIEDKDESKGDQVRPFVKKDITPNEIANMTVREARESLKKITDIKLLKYAYEQARQLAHKDSLCRMLRKRIQEVEITRR